MKLEKQANMIRNYDVNDIHSKQNLIDIIKINNPNINASVSITVTHENCSNIKEIFYYFTEDCKIDSIKCCLVRDEGVYTRPKEKVEQILNAYDWLTNKIKEYQKQKKIVNYANTIQGKIHNKKDEISWDLIKKIYKNRGKNGY